MKKIFALLIATLLMLNTFAFSVFAAKDPDEKKERKVRSVTISTDITTVQVNQMRTLFAYVLPADADHQEIFWSSSNKEIVVVDGDGDITGISPGTAIVTASSYDGKYLATCEVTVPSTVTTAKLYNVKEGAALPLANINGGEVLYAASLRGDVQAAINNASKNTVAKVTYQNKSRVSAAALRTADYAAREKNAEIELRFDTTTATGGIQGRLSINPALCGEITEDLRLRVWTRSEYIDELTSTLKTKLNDDFAVIYCEQPGAYGMTVKVAAKADLTGIDSTKLKLFKYSPSTNKLTELESSAFWLDANGYIQFKTNNGGVYIVTDYAV